MATRTSSGMVKLSVAPVLNKKLLDDSPSDGYSEVPAVLTIPDSRAPRLDHGRSYDYKPDDKGAPVRADTGLHSSSNTVHKEVVVSLIKSPQEVFEYLCHTGEVRPNIPIWKQAGLAFIAGCYLGLGFSCCLVCGLQTPAIKAADPGVTSILFGIYGFPLGLSLILVCGADLFTSDVCYMLVALCEGKTTILKLLRIWVVAYFLNLAGCIFMAEMFNIAGVFEHKELAVNNLALFKSSHTFGVTVVKGILANWMVNLAVMMASSARDLTGKLLGIFLPISAFVSMGFEHCIANMYLFPLSMMLDSGISVGDFITKNLIPATIGNIIGGGFFVGVFYCFIFGETPNRIEAVFHRLMGHLGLRGLKTPELYRAKK